MDEEDIRPGGIVYLKFIARFQMTTLLITSSMVDHT